jgi:hypothetical protein
LLCSSPQQAAPATIRLIDPSGPSSSLPSHCTALESQTTWNQKGQPGAPGKDGSSPTVAQLPAGDTHCATGGGASIADAAGDIAYVCNGAPFDGTFTSPNGRFTLTVADTGVSIVGPDSSVSLPAAGGIVIDASKETTTVGGDRTESVGGGSDSLDVSGNRTEHVDGALDISSAGTASIVGTFLQLNGGSSSCKPAVRLGDSVSSSVIVGGSPTVCIGG